MSEATVKISGWRAQCKPGDEDELTFYRKLVVEAVYGLSYAKKEAFGMDCSVSLEEIFTEVEHKLFYLQMCRALNFKKRGKRYVDRRVNECFEEDTLVQTPDGLERIEDLQPRDFIVGQSHGMLLGAQVLAHHTIRREGKLVELTLTNREKLVCTPDHLCLTEGGWIESARITENTVLVSGRTSTFSRIMATIRQRRNNEGISKSDLASNQNARQNDWVKNCNEMGSLLSCKSFAQDEGSPRSDRDREGLFSRYRGWGRFNINFSASCAKAKQKQILSLCAKADDFEHFDRIGRLAVLETSCSAFETTQTEIESEMENSLCLSGNRLQYGSAFGRASALPYNQEETSDSSTRILQAPHKPSWKRLFQRGDRNRRANSEYESTRVLAKRFLRFKGIVHDLTTTTGNYIANGVIVHNCACAKFYPDGVPKIAAATAGYYVVNAKRDQIK